MEVRPVAEETFAAVKAGLPPHVAKQCDDACIKRFIRASGGKAPTAIKRMEATVAWRAKEQPEQVVCNACRENPRSHYMHVVGFCRLERPVIYSCLEMASNRVVEDNKAHMISTFERAIRTMKHPVEQWVWVSDFHGFGFQDLNPGIAKVFAELAGSHYPERLGTFLAIDAPRMFNTLWKVVSQIVDPVTKAKVKFLPYDVKAGSKSVLRQELLGFFDEELTDWLLREMQENRNKSIAKVKCYSYDDLAKTAGQPIRTAASMPANLDDMDETHDMRGTPKFLHKVASEPQLLSPQVDMRPI